MEHNYLNMRAWGVVFILLMLLISGCQKDDELKDNVLADANLSIFFVNDQHGNIDNFSRIKHIIDAERSERTVFVVCCGDIFSGNPVVDYYPEKGYPMIDIMNRVGFDALGMGNHEFDYGPYVLQERMEQSEFPWICSNVDFGTTGIPEPYDYYTLEKDGFSISFLGLIETNGKQNAIIPSTHPYKIKDFNFDKPENVVADFAELKGTEDADLYIALTHLGKNSYSGSLSDYGLAIDFPYFDAILGGHSHSLFVDIVNDIPIAQAGSRLHNLGKISMKVEEKQVKAFSSDLIYLDNYPYYDADLKTIIDAYNEEMADALDDIIGHAQIAHSKEQLGCFYTDALRLRLEADISFQNTGGIRSDLNAGAISIGEVYAIDPFNNNAMIYHMSCAEIKTFLKGSGAGFYYSGVSISREGSNVILSYPGGSIIPDDEILVVGINDYIPAVHDQFFPETGLDQGYTTAEAIIYYLQHIQSEVNYPDCGNYFRY